MKKEPSWSYEEVKAAWKARGWRELDRVDNMASWTNEDFLSVVHIDSKGNISSFQKHFAEAALNGEDIPEASLRAWVDGHDLGPQSAMKLAQRQAAQAQDPTA